MKPLTDIPDTAVDLELRPGFWQSRMLVLPTLSTVAWQKHSASGWGEPFSPQLENVVSAQLACALQH